MKLLFDFLPVVLFFIAFKVYGIYVATAAAVAVSVAQVGFSWLRHRRVETMHLVTLALIVILGGATLLLHDEMFIKWKPTAVDWAFAAAFLTSQFVGGKPLVERMLTGTLVLPRPIWQRLNLSWVAFFLVMGGANVYVAYHFDTDTWVNFKLFGMLGLTIVFLVIQALYLARHIKADEDVQES